MKNLTFAAIKVYCCNQERNAPFKISIAGVRDGETQEVKNFMIRPEASEFDFTSDNTPLSALADEKPFEEMFLDINHCLQQYPILVSASDGYDTAVLHHTIMRYGIRCNPLPYVTAKNICRCVYDSCDYSYAYLRKQAGISPDNTGITEAEIWAVIVLKACKDAAFSADSLADFCIQHRLKPGAIAADPMVKSYIVRDYAKSRPAFEVDESTFDESNPFYGRSVVFTGTLHRMTRNEAMQHVLDIGGTCPKGINNDTNYLVVGEQSPAQVGPDGMSGKQKKAIKIREAGGDIEMLTEDEFWEML